MNPLEYAAVWSFWGVLLLCFALICSYFATVCTTGELWLFAFLFVATAGILGHGFGEQRRRDRRERLGRRHD